MDPLTIAMLAKLGAGGASWLSDLLNDDPDGYEIFRNLKTPGADELRKAGELGPSAYEGISEDPALRDAQLQALGYLQNLGNQQGMDMGAKVAHQEAMAATAQQERSNRGAIMEDAAQRGMRGSGNELLSQLVGSQGSAQRNAMAGQRAAADARMRALQAMVGAGQLGGQVRGQDWQQNAEKARARDTIGAFNAANSRSAISEDFAGRLARAQGMASGAQQSRDNRIASAGAGGTLAGGLGGVGLDWWQQNRNAARAKKPGEF
jgi:hypothetical protein